MRIVVLGAGAVGSVIGGRLHQHRAAHGHEITLVARPAHALAIRERGLVIHDPSGSDTIAAPVVERIDEITLAPGDVVVLATKTQDTPAALEQLSRCAPRGVRVACAQNGVENERLALRMVDHVYGICVMLPAGFMEPGVIDASGTPHNAILDVGRYPSGADDTSDALAAAFTASALPSRSIHDVMRWKYAKLMMNLANAADALVSDRDQMSRLIAPARAEADACFEAAGIVRVTDDEDRERRVGVMELRPIMDPSRHRGGGSTWQSIARGAGSTEVDWLNGEIVLLGRLHGVATPINELLCDAVRRAVVRGLEPRSLTVDQLLAGDW